MNDKKEIRFIDSHYNELFRIKDGESITVKFSDGSMSDRKCTYIDDYHTKIGYDVFHICEFAELMERGGSTYRPKDTPGYTLEKIEQSEFEYTFAPSKNEELNRGCVCYVRCYITITAKTKEEMIEKYHFTRKQQEALNTLLEQDEVLISAAQSLAVSDATAQDILKNLPDSLSAERKKVIKAACSLVGKVNYFWGGKSSAIGWDSEWGKLKTVSAEGSKTTGTKRPFGLDCSGFVTWSFINSGFNASQIGHGTQGQIAKCSRISWSNAQAGDLAFYGDLSHVGIIAGKDTDGNILVIHCSSGNNNVVITTNSGFGFAARPRCY